MAGGVHHVDAHAPPFDGGALRQDGNAALALLIHGIHGPFGNILLGVKNAALTQQGINQGRLAVVNMGDNGNIAQVQGLGALFYSIWMAFRFAESGAAAPGKLTARSRRGGAV